MSDDTDPQDDPLPRLIAEADQSAALAPVIAAVAWAYFDAFLANGFTEAQALHLVVTMLND